MFFTASLGYFLTMSKCLEVQWREFEDVVHIVKVQRTKQRFGEERMLALIIYV